MFCTLNRCTLNGNRASVGGGAANATLNYCTLSGNSVSSGGGGVIGCTLYQCTLTRNSAAYGGGAESSTLNACRLYGNTAVNGGGADSSLLNNCILTSNSANNPGIAGGGAFSSVLNNCTISANSASGAGGVGNCTLTNSIVYNNVAGDSPNYFGSSFDHCCTTPLPDGAGNFDNPPLFVNGTSDLHLQSNSPCINAGRNSAVLGTTDFAGNPRVSGGTVDMGAYEFQSPASVISYAWLQSYGLPTDGSADYTDPDRDGMNNWQEWVAGTNPTNAGSVLRMLSAKPTGTTNVVVTWSSASTRAYSLVRATNFLAVPAFSVVWSNIAGLADTTSFVDTNPPADPAAFYRVIVQPP
jgi:hypothetical protein